MHFSHRLLITTVVFGALVSTADAAAGQDHGGLARNPLLSAHLAQAAPIAAPPAVTKHSALARRISIRLTNVPLGTALNEISTTSEVPISYSRTHVPVERRVSIDVERVTLADALRRVLDGTGLRLWESKRGQVAVVPATGEQQIQTPAGSSALPRIPMAYPIARVASSTRQQVGIISGRVTNASTGAPLEGAQVAVLRTNSGALTGSDGRYTLSGVPDGEHVVRASYLGYADQSQTVAVLPGQSSTADFQLAPRAIQLQGVVAVGYGTQRRRDLTGSVASIDVEETQTAPLASVEQVLQGRAPGVQVVQANGAPGGAVSVRIRGTNSITAGSEPLYVIDGVPAFVGSGTSRAGGFVNPMSALAPNDIASIEILKDASATAIYGSRGANGVVLITTKRGRRGENTLQFESSYGMQEVTREIPMLNGREFAELHNEARVNSGLEPAFTEDELATIGEGTNWQDEIFRSAPVQSHALTISGGDEATRYLISGGFFDQRGIVDNTGFQRYSARLNLDRDVSSRFRVGNSLNISHTAADVVNTDASVASGLITDALQFSPVASVRDAEGNYIMQSPLGVPSANPVATVRELTDKRGSSRLIGNLFGEYDLTDALRFRTSLGGNIAFARDEFYAPQNVIQGVTSGGTARATTSQALELVNENILTYNRSVRRGDQLDVTGGFTVQTFRSEFLRGGAQQFATDITGAKNLGAGARPLTPGSGVNEWSLLSGLGKANYTLLDRYLFTFTGRYDGSSKFGANSKWGFFPSGAFAWRLSEESFMRDVSVISDFKLRASYGLTGNQEIGTFASLARLRDESYVLGSRQVITYAPAGQAPNPDLKWETTRQFDIGFDLALFENRISITGDVYAGTTDDLLLLVPLPQTSGYTSQLRNLGSVKNRGAELGINSVNVEGERFTWRTGLNIAANRNRVVDLGGVESVFPAATRNETAFEGGITNIIQVDEPLGSMYGYRTNGIWQTGDSCPLTDPSDCTPGEWKYIDVNGDGVIGAGDRTILGSAQPDFFGGLTNNFTLGPLSLDLFLQGSFGNEVVNGNSVFLRSLTTASNESASSFDRWTPTNPSNTVPRAHLERVRRLKDVFVEDGSYVRLQNVTLGYGVPERFLSGAREARLYVSGQNLYTWTDYTGYDPEVNSYGNNSALRGVDFGMYPRSRTVNVGLNVTF